MKFRLLVSSMAIAACGAPDKSAQDAANVEDTHSDSLYVADASGLPECSSTSEGRLAYVASEKVLKACLGGAWTAVELSKGEPGKDGKDGAKGTDGTSNAVVKSTRCSGEAGSTNVLVEYLRYDYKSGDAMIVGSVSGNVYQTTNVVWYSPKQNGYASGSITVASDLAGSGTSGFWVLSRDPDAGDLLVSYNDAELSPSTENFQIDASDCTVNEFDTP